MRDKLIFLLLFLLWVTPVEATKQFLVVGSQNFTSANVEYNAMTGGQNNGAGSWTTNEISRTTLIGASGTLSNLRVTIEGSVNAGDTRTFTIRINQADSSLACTITDSSSNACTDTGGLSVTAGDRWSIQTSQTGSCCTGAQTWNILFDGTDTSATILTGGSQDDTSVSNGNDFPMHANRSAQTAVTAVQTIFPLAGTLKNLYVRSETTIGSGNTIVFTIVDSSAVSTGITCTLTNAGGQTCNDTANTQAVTAGERYSILIATTGTTNTHGALYWGIELTATTEGQFGMYHSSSDSTQATNTEYNWPCNGGALWTTGATIPDNMSGQAGTIQAAYVQWGGTNGAGDTITFTLESDIGGGFSDSDIVIVLTEGQTSGNDAGTINAIDDEKYRIKYVPVTPDGNGRVQYAFRAFIDPGVAVIAPGLFNVTIFGTTVSNN